MSETLYNDIRAAFTQRLLAISGLPEVAWENKEYTPTAGVPYIAPALLMAEPEQAGIGTASMNVERGIYQVKLEYPPNQGVGPVNAMAGKIKDQFKRGTLLTYNGVQVTIRKAGFVSQQAVVSIAFFSYTPN